MRSWMTVTMTRSGIPELQEQKHRRVVGDEEQDCKNRNHSMRGKALRIAALREK